VRGPRGVGIGGAQLYFSCRFRLTGTSGTGIALRGARARAAICVLCSAGIIASTVTGSASLNASDLASRTLNEASNSTPHPLGPTVKFTENAFMFSIAQITALTRVVQASNSQGTSIAPPGTHFLEFQLEVTNDQTDRPAPGLPSFLANPVISYFPSLQFGTTDTHCLAPTAGNDPSSCLYLEVNVLGGGLQASQSVLLDIFSSGLDPVPDTTTIDAMQLVWHEGQADFVLPLVASSSSASPPSSSSSSRTGTPTPPTAQSGQGQGAPCDVLCHLGNGWSTAVNWSSHGALAGLGIGCGVGLVGGLGIFDWATCPVGAAGGSLLGAAGGGIGGFIVGLFS